MLPYIAAPWILLGMSQSWSDTFERSAAPEPLRWCHPTEAGGKKTNKNCGDVTKKNKDRTNEHRDLTDLYHSRLSHSWLFPFKPPYWSWFFMVFHHIFHFPYIFPRFSWFFPTFSQDPGLPDSPGMSILDPPSRASRASRAEPSRASRASRLKMASFVA